MPTLHHSIPFTKERFYMEHADRHGAASLERHLARYRWAAALLNKGASVLHAGCGSGYGDDILLEKAASVTSVDMSQEAVEYAKRENRSDATYIQADLRTLNLSTRFDAVVCIEVIEHVGESDQIKILDVLASHLKDGGVLFITTPERSATGPRTEFHDHEFSRPEFGAFLAGRFNNVAFSDPADFPHIPPDFVLAVCQGVKKY